MLKLEFQIKMLITAIGSTCKSDKTGKKYKNNQLLGCSPFIKRTLVLKP